MTETMKKLTAPPSTTVTWAFLAGVGAAIVWEIVGTFTQFNPTPGLISGSTAFASGLVGKMVRERRYKMELNPR